MTKESKLQVKRCDAGMKQKSGPVGAWSNYLRILGETFISINLPSLNTY
jgi:hypothetical protein